MHRKKRLHMQRRITDKRPLLQTDAKRVARYQANVKAMNEPFSRHPKPKSQTAIVPQGFWDSQIMRPNFRPVEWDKAVA